MDSATTSVQAGRGPPPPSVHNVQEKEGGAGNSTIEIRQGVATSSLSDWTKKDKCNTMGKGKSVVKKVTDGSTVQGGSVIDLDQEVTSSSGGSSSSSGSSSESEVEDGQIRDDDSALGEQPACTITEPSNEEMTALKEAKQYVQGLAMTTGERDQFCAQAVELQRKLPVLDRLTRALVKEKCTNGLHRASTAQTEQGTSRSLVGAVLRVMEVDVAAGRPPWSESGPSIPLHGIFEKEEVDEVWACVGKMFRLKDLHEKKQAARQQKTECKPQPKPAEGRKSK